MAVTIALWFVVKVPAVAVKVAAVAPAATVTDTGTVSAAILLDNEITAPPVGAVWDKLTVHVEVLPVPRRAGVQDSELTTAGGISEIVAVFDVLL